MRILRTQGRGAKDAKAKIEELEKRGGAALDAVQPAVRKILGNVRRDGDDALLRYARKFDGLAKDDSVQVTPEETAAAWQQLDPKLKQALEAAAGNIRAFAKRQMPQNWQFSPVEG